MYLELRQRPADADVGELLKVGQHLFVCFTHTHTHNISAVVSTKSELFLLVPSSLFFSSLFRAALALSLLHASPSSSFPLSHTTTPTAESLPSFPHTHRSDRHRRGRRCVCSLLRTLSFDRLAIRSPHLQEPTQRPPPHTNDGGRSINPCPPPPAQHGVARPRRQLHESRDGRQRSCASQATTGARPLLHIKYPRCDDDVLACYQDRMRMDMYRTRVVAFVTLASLESFWTLSI